MEKENPFLSIIRDYVGHWELTPYKVNRLVIVNGANREKDMDVQGIMLSLQDDGKTLKIFYNPKNNQ